MVIEAVEQCSTFVNFLKLLEQMQHFLLLFHTVMQQGYEEMARNIITALHGMQTRSSDENSVCPSVRHTRGL